MTGRTQSVLLPSAALRLRSFILLVCGSSARSAEKPHTKDGRYHAAVRPERIGNQLEAIRWWYSDCFNQGLMHSICDRTLIGG
jgi:hypothetical protein